MHSACESILYYIFQNIDDSMLQQIAEADYGLNVDVHFKALMAIRDGNISKPMEWTPKEVLFLTCWSEPNGSTQILKATELRDHWIRFLACAILICVDTEAESCETFYSDPDYTAIQLVDSALKLGEDTSVTALRLLHWARQQHKLEFEGQECPYFAIAILLLTVRLNQCDRQIEQSLIAAATPKHMKIAELFGRCQLEQK
jgi:hypothetical protein